MKKFKFKYKDAYTKGEWHTTIGVCRSLNELIRFYGLDKDDVEWELISEEDC